MPDPRVRTLLLCLVLAVLLMHGFGILALTVTHPGLTTWLTPLDGTLNATFHEHGQTNPQARTFFVLVSELCDYENQRRFGHAVAVVLAILALVALARRSFRSAANLVLLTAVWLVALEVAWDLNYAMKDVIHRPRPALAPPKKTSSFPSAHSMRAVLDFGLLAYLLVIGLPRRWERVAAVLALGALTLLVGLSRMYLVEHYFTDVLGGFAYGAVWLLFWVGIVETYRLRPSARPAPAVPVPPKSPDPGPPPAVAASQA